VAYKVVLSTEKQEAMAKNAVGDFLFRRLIVPKVFFDANWPNRSSRVDVLAVDRSGSGEIHVVEVKRAGSKSLKDLKADIENAVTHLMQVKAHFKYLALFDNSKNVYPNLEMLDAPDGFGRIGVIQVKEDHEGNLSSEITVRPVRFKLDSSIFKMIDRFTASRPANLEVRP
jgi:hypothetical protein